MTGVCLLRVRVDPRIIKRASRRGVNPRPAIKTRKVSSADHCEVRAGQRTAPVSMPKNGHANATPGPRFYNIGRVSISWGFSSSRDAPATPTANRALPQLFERWQAATSTDGNHGDDCAVRRQCEQATMRRHCSLAKPALLLAASAYRGPFHPSAKNCNQYECILEKLTGKRRYRRFICPDTHLRGDVQAG
jgi:hypothetical protein